jgi:hypothetical protein
MFRIPQAIPIARLAEAFFKNSAIISIKELKVKEISSGMSSSPTKSKMELYKMIETESLTMPSPKITLNNFGYVSDFIIANAATLSVAQIVAENSKISLVSRLISVSKSLYLRTQPFRNSIVKNKKEKKCKELLFT